MQIGRPASHHSNVSMLVLSSNSHSNNIHIHGLMWLLVVLYRTVYNYCWNLDQTVPDPLYRIEV